MSLTGNKQSSNEQSCGVWEHCADPPMSMLRILLMVLHQLNYFAKLLNQLQFICCKLCSLLCLLLSIKSGALNINGSACPDFNFQQTFHSIIYKVKGFSNLRIIKKNVILISECFVLTTLCAVNIDSKKSYWSYFLLCHSSTVQAQSFSW